MNRTKLVAVLATIVAIFAAGLATGWWLYHPTVKPETYKPAVKQKDGSVILERNPNGAVSAPMPALPRKPARTIQVTVKPKPVPVEPDSCALECPAVNVRLDLVKDDDGQRVIASSPDGDIIGGMDVPHEPWIKRNENLWAAGLTYSHDRRLGAFLDRDLGPFRAGIEADAESVRVRVGIRF